MNVTDIDINDFNYPLPPDRIALHPLADRDKCKLLLRRHDGSISDYIFSDIVSLLPSPALLVYNNTRVINSRLKFRKPSGAVVEIFCLEPYEPCDYSLSFASTSSCVWKCLVGNSKRWKDGLLRITIEICGLQLCLSAQRVERFEKYSLVRFSWNNPAVSFSQIVSQVGEIPIPPYLNRKSESCDEFDYQTVFGKVEGSVAAPTAGLHFTDSLLSKIDEVGISRREITLHVGAGTFQPVKTETIGEHMMHHELIDVGINLIEELARGERPVVAVGTTSVRTLESLYHLGRRVLAGESIAELPQWYPYSGPDVPVDKALLALVQYLRSAGISRLVSSTAIIIAPGYKFKIVDAIITNFHQPCSTLLLLISAFTGGDWKRMYKHALDSSYRFLSYGDAMLLF